MTAKKFSMIATWSDPEDASELTEAFFKRADEYDGRKLKTRGRPKGAMTKEPIKTRLDADLVAALCESGERWQTRINDTLRASLTLAGRLESRLPNQVAPGARNQGGQPKQQP